MQQEGRSVDTPRGEGCNDSISVVDHPRAQSLRLSVDTPSGEGCNVELGGGCNELAVPIVLAPTIHSHHVVEKRRDPQFRDFGGRDGAALRDQGEKPGVGGDRYRSTFLQFDGRSLNSGWVGQSHVHRI